MSEPPSSPTSNTVITCSTVTRKAPSGVHLAAAQNTPAPSVTDQEAPTASSENEKHDPMSVIKDTLEKPAFFSCRVDLNRESIFEILMSLASPRTSQEHIDRFCIAETVSYLSTPRWNPRNRVAPRNYTSEDLTKWIWFLKRYRIPVFLWEYMTYVDMLDALSKMGVDIDGGLVKLVTLKKQSFNSNLRIPFESFQILEVEKAKHWILLPEKYVKDQGQSLEEWITQLIKAASDIEAWPTQHADIIANNMKTSQYSKFGLEDHLNNHVKAVLKASIPKFMRDTANQFFRRVNGMVPTQPLPKLVEFQASDAKIHDADEDLDKENGGQWCNPFYILRMLWAETPEWIIEHLPNVTHYNLNRPTIDNIALILHREQQRQPRVV